MARSNTPVLVVLLALAACAPGDRLQPGEERPLEDVEVTDVLDAEIDLSEDEKGPRVEEGVSGLLPADFPADLPLVTPSSLIDYGAAGGSRFVLLATPGAESRVRSAQLDLARQAGWSVEELGGGWRLVRGGRRVRLTVDRVGGATELRFDY